MMLDQDHGLEPDQGDHEEDCFGLRPSDFLQATSVKVF